MRGQLSLIALTAAGLLLSGARGAMADHQRYGSNGNDQGSRYQQAGWHSERAVPQVERQWRGDGQRSDTAYRVDERGQGQWGQSPFGYIGAADRGHWGAADRHPAARGFAERNGRGGDWGRTAYRGADGAGHRGDRHCD